MNSARTLRNSDRNRRLSIAACVLGALACALADSRGLSASATGTAYAVVVAITFLFRLRALPVAFGLATSALLLAGSLGPLGGGSSTPDMMARGLGVLAIGALAAYGWAVFSDTDPAQESKLQRKKTDRVTGVATRSFVMQELERRTQPSLLSDSEIALLLVDIDNFKSVNHRFGNWVGDRLLRRVSTACRQSIRGTDLVGRIGAEDFALVCPGSSIRDAQLIAHRIQASIEDLDLSSFAFDSPVTVSIGVAGWSRNSGDMSDLLNLADVALFEAKHHGRNRIAMRTRLQAN